MAALFLGWRLDRHRMAGNDGRRGAQRLQGRGCASWREHKSQAGSARIRADAHLWVRASYFASSATPRQTRIFATQRRRSTFSPKNNCAAIALVTNVSDAVAGTTRLKSAHDKLTRR